MLILRPRLVSLRMFSRALLFIIQRIVGEEVQTTTNPRGLKRRRYYYVARAPRSVLRRPFDGLRGNFANYIDPSARSLRSLGRDDSLKRCSAPSVGMTA